ncbi:MAG TPA: CNNM domain-containing protein [Chthoniobacterales bacterium]|jgi:CBS domain containing-hemolysin-like protein
MSFVLLLACWIISFLFAGIEAGLLALDPVRLRHRAKNGDRAAQRLERMLEEPERLLITVLLATNGADIVALIILTQKLVQAYGPVGYLVAIAIALPVYLLLLGVLPKSLFRRFPLRAVIRLSRMLELATKFLWPVHTLGEFVEHSIFMRAKNPARLFAGREELKLITVQSEHGGALTSTERAMIHNVVDFTSVKVRDVMVPLAATVSLKADDEPGKALALSESSGIDRFPILTQDSRPLGLVNVFDILVDTDDMHPLRHYMRRIITTSETDSAYRVVRRLRAARIGLAAVVDTREKLTGIVALEDLVRQLVRA